VQEVVTPEWRIANQGVFGNGTVKKVMVRGIRHDITLLISGIGSSVLLFLLEAQARERILLSYWDCGTEEVFCTQYQ
jgi:hypothetical protein